MDILKQFNEKINGTNVLLKEFHSFAAQQTDTLCNHMPIFRSKDVPWPISVQVRWIKESWRGTT